jgi:glutaredoxin-related protein
MRILQFCCLTPQEIRYIFIDGSGLNEYKSVNVLENPIIREQVRIFSKWPTYPQLYIEGQLIGGSDILHEMHKDQSLQKLLEEKGII